MQTRRPIRWDSAFNEVRPLKGVRIVVTDRPASMARRPIPAVQRAGAEAIDKDRFRPRTLYPALFAPMRCPSLPYIRGRYSAACRMRFDHDRTNDLTR